MFEEIGVRDFLINPPTEFGKNWMLVTAGNAERGYNTMTIAWGQMGAIWDMQKHINPMPTVVCYVRPQRYTKKFIDSESIFTLSSFSEKYKKALLYLGSHSGRDGDKIAAAGLTPVFSDGTTYFAEAERVYICRKIYQAPIKEEYFIDHEIVDFNYPARDFHDMYIGEILKVLKKA